MSITTQPTRLRCHQKWARTLSEQQDQTLFAVVYFFEVIAGQSWGRALPKSAHIWETPRILKKDGTPARSINYRTCAIMNSAQLASFMKDANLHVSAESTNIGQLDLAAQDPITPVFQQLLPHIQESIEAIELKGDSLNHGVVDFQHALVVPFGTSILNDAERAEMFTKAYESMCSKT
jgi:hypothetical protein